MFLKEKFHLRVDSIFDTGKQTGSQKKLFPFVKMAEEQEDVATCLKKIISFPPEKFGQASLLSEISDVLTASGYYFQFDLKMQSECFCKDLRTHFLLYSGHTQHLF